MQGRRVFHTAMRALEDDLIAMTDLAGNALVTAVAALVGRDEAAAKEVIAGDERLNALWTDLERAGLTLIATQSPMAVDLREIVAITHIATDLERVGDHAKSIAQAAVALVGEPSLGVDVAVERMAELANELLRAELDAFIRRDGELARQVALRDNEIDQLYHRLYRDLIERMANDPSCIDRAQRLLSVAKSLERIGDHVTNIGEYVVFLTTGRLVELNQ